MEQNPVYLDNYRPGQSGIPMPGQQPQSPEHDPNQPYESVHGNTKLLQFPDGSAAIGENNAPKHNEQLNPQDHQQNLAKVLSDLDVQQIGFELKMAVEEDRQSQEKYFEAIAESTFLISNSLEAPGDNGKLINIANWLAIISESIDNK